MYKDEIAWHDIRNDPDDLPGNGEPIFVTLEMPHDGTRMVWIDVVLQDDESGDGYSFVVNRYDHFTGRIEPQPVWYKVIAWAYPPSPYPI